MTIRALTPVAHARSASDRVRSVSGMEHLPDSVLVERSLTGDSWAEEMLYRRHAAMLLGLCTRLLRDGADAEDVVQDAFLDALEELATLRDPAQFRGWLTGIAVHKVHRRLRRRKLLRALGLWEPRNAESLESCLAPGVSAEHYADIVCLDMALRKLADALRISWELRYIEGFRLEEVAKHCGCSLATVKRRIAEADALVRRYVEFDGGGRG
jgi:RNA polymerase sigma-70 factor (ECF subfamily)